MTSASVGQSAKKSPEPLLTCETPHPRYCARCGTKLSRYNSDRLCGPCNTTAHGELAEPPQVPMGFWLTDQMHDALATWHMGRVVYAYRTHPFHGKTLPQEIVGNWLGLTQAQLSRIEKGDAPQQLSKLIRWARVLNIPTDLLWFKLPPTDTDRLDDVNRQNFLRTAIGTTAASVTGSWPKLLVAIEPTPAPSHIGSVHIEQIRTAASEFTSWDHTYGGGMVREAVCAQLRYAVDLLNAKCTDKDRDELHSAVGFLGHTAGFMAFDSYAHRDAEKMFRLAWHCAETADDWHLRGKVLSSMARQAIWCGGLVSSNTSADQRRKYLENGLTYTNLALVRRDRLTATERAMLYSAQARALAKLQRTQETLAAIGHADEEFTHAEPNNDPPWMAYYDSAQHFGDTGHALYDLAIQGKFASEARSRLNTAVHSHAAQFVRSKTISAIKLASLTLATGDPSEAIAIGSRALANAEHIRSRRAADDLRELANATCHHKSTEMEELRHHISSTVTRT